MSSDKTIDGVPRELAESIVRMLQAGGAWDTAEQLRALLDAPAETEVVHEVQWNSIHGPEGWKIVDAPTYHRCTGHLWDRRITRKPAAQPQGEPVAYLDLEKLQPSGMAYATKIRVNHRQTALYAEQPAPVASVIDDNVEFEKWWMSTPILRKQKIQIAQEAWFARANLSK